MTAVHFRPKYDIEQYLVLFSFPAALDNYPEISVELVSGNASDVESFAGLPVIQGADIFVRVTGGTAGCVYKIICAGSIGGIPVSQKGIIAVMPTKAEIPSGIPPAPLTRFYTTPPYPAYVEDSLGVSSVARDGFVWLLPMDEVGVTSHALDGVHRELIARYAMEPDEVGVVSYALDGTHRPLIASYTTEPEEIEISSIALNGTHRVIVIPYLNYEPEEVEVTSYALDGTHGPA